MLPLRHCYLLHLRGYVICTDVRSLTLQVFSWGTEAAERRLSRSDNISLQGPKAGRLYSDVTPRHLKTTDISGHSSTHSACDYLTPRPTKALTQGLLRVLNSPCMGRGMCSSKRWLLRCWRPRICTKVARPMPATISLLDPRH